MGSLYEPQFRKLHVVLISVCRLLCRLVTIDDVRSKDDLEPLILIALHHGKSRKEKG